MSGAIPYYRVQESILKSRAASRLEHPANVQALPCEVAHHVNNLLMRIQGWISLMLLDVKRGQAGFDRLKQIEGFIDYGAVLTSQLLACVGRGVYADPVNIPPLLLDPRDDTRALSSDCDVRATLFIVFDARGRLRPDLPEACRNISERIASVFVGIESLIRRDCASELGEQYTAKIKRVNDEGLRIARSAAADFGLNKSVYRYPLRQQTTTPVAPVMLPAGLIKPGCNLPC